MDDSIYRDQIIDLYETPMNYGSLDPADLDYEEDNPLCGDVIRVTVQLDEGDRVSDVRWEGQGCAISQASASLLTEEIKGLTLQEVKEFSKDQLLSLLGIQLSMTRVKCALLSLKVLKAGAYGMPDPADLRTKS